VTPRAAIIGPSARPFFDQLDRSEVDFLEFWIGAGYVPEGGIALSDLRASDPTPIVDRDPDDPAVLAFTSGTAGSPRAAILTHNNLHVNLRQIVAAALEEAQGSADVSFAVLPFFHIYGLNVVLGLTLYVGATAVLVERFDPMSALEAIERHKVSVLAGPPTIWAAFAGMYGVAADMMASVNIAVSGAAKLPDQVADAIKALFDLDLKEGYGLTEASPAVTLPLGNNTPRGSVGSVLPGIEVRLVDLEGNDVLVGDSGELWVRGPNVFKGYWGDEVATARVLDSDGWLHTGDVAVVDDDGFIYLVDRIKDLIIVSGFNVYPAEVEEVIVGHPSVEACAVVGVPHPHTGEAVKAYVKPVAGVSIEENDVIDYCTEQLPRYKCPNKVWFIDELPQGLAGKVLRYELRNRANEEVTQG
jgi:long-chain acyl-CoA synthetase